LRLPFGKRWHALGSCHRGCYRIGKTMVWKHVIRATPPGGRVLSCRPAPAESLLAFSALDDLFSGVIEEVLPQLPEARRRALDAVLLRGRPAPPATDQDAAGREPERRVLARGILDALRVLSTDRPLVLAVDNAQWLDRPSAGVLEFCIRRLQHEASYGARVAVTPSEQATAEEVVA
jgi:hypothetical protein